MKHGDEFVGPFGIKVKVDETLPRYAMRFGFELGECTYCSKKLEGVLWAYGVEVASGKVKDVMCGSCQIGKVPLVRMVPTEQICKCDDCGADVIRLNSPRPLSQYPDKLKLCLYCWAIEKHRYKRDMNHDIGEFQLSKDGEQK